MITLLLNQVRKDLRQSATLLIMLVGAALFELYEGLQNSNDVIDAYGNLYVGANMSGMAVTLLVLVGFLIPVLAGWSDSVSDNTGFIQTRPVPGQVVWGSKIVVMMLGVWLPLSLPPCIISLVHGAGASHALLVAGERLAYVIPATLFALGWGGIGGDRVRFLTSTLVATGIVMATFWIALGLNHLIDAGRVHRILNEPGSMPWRLLVIFWLGAGASMLVLIKQTRGPRLRYPLAMVVAALSIGLLGVMTLADFNPLRPKAAPVSEQLARQLDQVTVQPDPYTLQSWRAAKNRRVTLQSHLRVEGVPPTLFVTPTVSNARLLCSDGSVFEAEGRRQQMSRFRENPSTDMVFAVANLFDEEVSLYRGRDSANFDRNPVQVTTWSGDGLSELVQEPASVNLDLDLHCVRFEPVGRVRLDEASEQGTRMGALTVFGSRNAGWFALRTRKPWAWLTRDEDRVVHQVWADRFKYVCVLKNPNFPRGLLCQSETIRTVRAHLSGCPEFFFEFRYETHHSVKHLFDEKFLKDAEIHVFRRRIEGVHPAQTKLENLRFELYWIDNDRKGDHRSLDEEAFERALVRLGEVPSRPDASYLDSLTALIESSQNRGGTVQEESIERLGMIAQRERSLVVDALCGDKIGFYSRRLLSEVFVRHGQIADKPRLIEALPGQPELAGILVQKGWERDARDQIMELLQTRQPMPLGVLQAAVVLEDPAMYPYLIEQFNHRPHTSTYKLLRNVPSLRPRLSRIIQERWSRARRVVLFDNLNSWDEFELALLNGDKHALALALNHLKGDPSQSAIYDLRYVLLLPRNSREAQARLQQINADDFVFNPELGVFLSRKTEDRP